MNPKIGHIDSTLTSIDQEIMNFEFNSLEKYSILNILILPCNDNSMFKNHYIDRNISQSYRVDSIIFKLSDEFSKNFTKTLKESNVKNKLY